MDAAPSLASSRTPSVSSLHIGETTELAMTDGQTQSVAAKIDEIGFGIYQIQVFLLCAGVIVSEAACLQTAAALSTAIVQEFDIADGIGKSAYMLVTYVGFVLGTLLSGSCGDALGRRYPMLLAYVGMILSSIGTLCAPSYGLLSFGFFTLGCFAGVGVPAAFIIVAETSPTSMRGVTSAAMAVAFVLGELWTAMGFCLFMPEMTGDHWRFAIAWAALPSIALTCLASCSRVTRFDTPHFLGVRGSPEELLAVMNLMAEMNGKPECEMVHGSVSVDRDDALSMGEALSKLTSGALLLDVGVIGMMFFVKDIAFYGMGLFWPLAWQESPDVGDLNPATELLLTAALGFPGVAVAMVLTFALPRRLAFATSALLCAVGVWAVQGLLLEDIRLGLTGVVLFKLFYPTAQMTVFLLPSEIFSTQVRVWSMSLTAACGRLATLLAPLLINASQLFFLTLTCTLLVVTAILVWLLPETKDQELKNSSSQGLAKQDRSSYGSTSSKSAAELA
mmetsp:Transcript_44551/g.80064  ORF Transcript_44551/g.80064 Transcript_44551/m.80064 type:complete len:505 (+) Transcript_44551:103-1617(+)|eukprot:CAMPEP_0197660224 /NCGR_PEP_ID=MMETSP1338-20131121/50722_1 /TAXON_ID=43686 ORGANISM="Pelagodinium beii, Strain RCC1491" /NCGR_SAMPLE_ID=MMETSP1338 /ASSEMBLY_ACC=CAM_ASM_000754 /LENGTH=504 /DNA_ID=CAMNT_0043237539 /DNA_START=88 /DNA_END=1602 /DNA_ORIENTATION=-